MLPSQFSPAASRSSECAHAKRSRAGVLLGRKKGLSFPSTCHSIAVTLLGSLQVKSSLCIFFIYFRPHWVVATARALSPFVVPRPLSAAASLAAEHWLSSADSVVGHMGPRALQVARGIPQDQGSNSSLLLWQADSQPLDHQGSPFSLHLDYSKPQGGARMSPPSPWPSPPAFPTGM